MNFVILRLLKLPALCLVLITINTGCKSESIAEAEAVEIGSAEQIEEVGRVPFNDISNHYEGIDSIATLYEGGVIKGFDDNSFRPEQFLTEAQFLLYLTLFYDVFGEFDIPFERDEGDFADVIYKDLLEYNFPLLGYEDEEKMHLPIKDKRVITVISMLYEESEEIHNTLQTELVSLEREEGVEYINRAQFVYLLYKLENMGLNVLQDEVLVTLKEAYQLEKEFALQEQQKKVKEDLKQEKRSTDTEPKEKLADGESLNNSTVKQTSETETSTKQTKEVIFTVESPEVPMTDLLLPSENSRPRITDVTHVMIHFMSNGLNKPHDPYNIKGIEAIFTNYGVSAHYVIDRSGNIYRFVTEDRVAFHAGKGELPGFPEYKDKMNDYSIGIELLAIGTREEMLMMSPGFPYDSIDPSNVGYTSEQYNTLNKLLDDINKRHPEIPKNRNHIIGHDEYSPGRKTDPGSLFDWSKIGF